jgi:hypothetical protein
MTKVFVARTPMEAQFVKDLLEREGISGDVQGEWLFGAMGEIPFTLRLGPLSGC